MELKYKKYLSKVLENQRELIFFLPKDKGTHIGLPNKFIAPSSVEGIFENDQFYWDSYFIILGLLETNQINLAKGMVENFAYLYKKYHIIPLRNRYFNLGISQPPFFSSMVLEIFNKTKDKNWLKEMVNIIENELREYWMDGKGSHLVFRGLSRYNDSWNLHLTAEHESGWDMTSRFFERCLDFLPIDLNCLLYKYEKDLHYIYSELGNTMKSNEYLNRSEKRKKTINDLMWNDEKGFYFDYDYKNKNQSDFFSIAGFYPLWVGLATFEQAKKIRNNLYVFECDGGLANTQKNDLIPPFKQWDYPNAWPNQQWIVIKGLLIYGFLDDAERLSRKWLKMNINIYEKTGAFWEKYDVLSLNRGIDGRYPTQKGFGWTDAIFIKLTNLFNEDGSFKYLKKGKNI